jgi:hypothetical protein
MADKITLVVHFHMEESAKREFVAKMRDIFANIVNEETFVTDRADRGWEAGSRHLATDLPSRMRCSRAPTHSPGDGGWRLRTLMRKLE